MQNDFEKEFKKVTELIKNKEIIEENPNFKNYGSKDIEYFLNLPKNKKERKLLNMKRKAIILIKMKFH